VIYSLARIYQGMNHKQVMVIVPTTSLVEQMYKDFDDYAQDVGWTSEDNCHRIYSGKDKNTDKPIIITTWQSIYNLPKSFFENIGMVIGDEAHNFKAKSLIKIMTKLVNCEYRIGTTGTLDDKKVHKLQMEGLFGPVYEVTTTRELMDRDFLAKLSIKCVILQYPEKHRKLVKEMDYQGEIKYLISSKERNRKIVELVNSLKGNTLVLYQLVENHGEVLYEMFLEDNQNPVSFIHGGINPTERERIREETEKLSDSIIVASYGTFSTGVNIRNLHNIVFASPSKSRVRNLQSIGRGLRKSDEKTEAILYDVVDDLSTGDYLNYTMKHYLARLDIYDEQRFDYSQSKIALTNE